MKQQTKQIKSNPPQRIINMGELQKRLSSRSSRREFKDQDNSKELNQVKNSNNWENNQTGFKSFYIGDQATIFDTEQRKSPSFAPKIEVQGAYQTSPHTQFENSCSSISQMTNK